MFTNNNPHRLQLVLLWIHLYNGGYIYITVINKLL